MTSNVIDLKSLFERIRPMSVEEQDRIEAQRRAREHAELGKLRKRRLERSGIADHLREQDVRLIVTDRCEPRKMQREAMAWYKSRFEKSIFYMGGTTGTGKTVASGWLLGREGGMFVTAHRLLRVFNSRYGKASLDNQDQLMAAPFLVIDDVDREVEEERAALASALLETLDGRRSKPTVVTGNLPWSKFKALYCDGRLLSRMEQSATYVHSNERDMRFGI